MTTEDMTMDEALIRLHEGTDRQGPGGDIVSTNLLRRLPELPSDCAIADLGCGTGVASLLLAQHFQQPVLCVDTSPEFLKALSAKAESLGMAHLIKPLCADMGTLDPNTYRFDLLWSEGAAYNLTFEGAMRKWRPLMVTGGYAVVSEMSWFSSEPPQEVLNYWCVAYPEMADEQVNTNSAERHGFKVMFTERLPAKAWWANYYDPLSVQLDAYANSTSETMQAAISETRQEIDLYRRHSDHFGYTFYALEVV